MAVSMTAKRVILKATGFLRSRIQCTNVSNLLAATRYTLSSQRFRNSFEVPRENVPISRFPVGKISSLPDDFRNQIEERAEAIGFMPNVFKALAYRPTEFRAFFDYFIALMDKESGSLTKAERELIVVATSAANNCMYCVVSHKAFHRVFSKDPYVADQLAIDREMANLTPRERAMVEFAIDICKMNPIKDEDFKALKQHGLSQDDIWDVGAIAAFFALSNRMVHLGAFRPNEEFYTMGRIPEDEE